MAAAIVGALIGSVGVVLGVLFGQSLQSYGRTRAKATALARDIGTLGASLLDRFTPDGSLAQRGWGPDYYRFGATLSELLDCCQQIVDSIWSKQYRRQYKDAIRSLDRIEAMWAAAHVKLDQGKTISENEINALMLAFGSVGRVLRPGAATDIGGYVKVLQKRVGYFVEHGIDANPKEAGL